MPFVKLDCGILDSTLWVDRDAREVFLTALLMAEPWEAETDVNQLSVRSLETTGFRVPAGWYGIVHAAGTGIVRRAGLPREAGLSALERLGSSDPESRSHDFDGRRLVRIDGGYVVMNYVRYRERDYTNAERQKRWRDRHRNVTEPLRNAVKSRSVTHADADADADADAGAGEHKTKHPASAGPATPGMDVADAAPSRQGRPRPLSAVDANVECVVAYYVSKRPNRRPGAKERACVAARLKEGFTVDELKDAIDGCLARPYVNDAGKVFDGLELIMRNSAKVNQYRAQCPGAKADRAAEELEARAKRLGLDKKEHANGSV